MLWRQVSLNEEIGVTFIAFLKASDDCICLMLYGSEFHRSGAQNAKLRSPYIFVRTLWTFKNIAGYQHFLLFPKCFLPYQIEK